MAYRPLKFFTFLGSIPSVFGLLLWLRWLILYFQDPTRALAPSLIISAVLILIGFQLYMFGLLADLLTVNRKLLEDIQLRQRRADLESHNKG